MTKSARLLTSVLFACWAADALAQVSGSQAAVTAPSPTVIVQCLSTDGERALKTQLDEARVRLAKVKEESNMPDHAVAALLVSDRPGLAPLVRMITRRAYHGSRQVTVDVYGSARDDETMVAVVVNLKNPRDRESWEPTEAVVKTPFGPETFAAFGLAAPWLPPKPAAVRSVPQRALPGQSVRIAVVFDRTDIELAGGDYFIELRRDGKPEFQFTLEPSELIAMSKGGGAP